MDWFSPRPTQEENMLPQPPCENLLARPCNPPLCCKRPPRTPTSAFAPLEPSVFPLIAPSTESRSPIILSSFSLLLDFLYKTVSEDVIWGKRYFTYRRNER